jgi:trimeric autotransporter adhesin
MKRILAAVAAALGLLVSAGQAAASGPADSALELAAQAVASGQAAAAQSAASQSRPANQNVSVRVQSPGSGGDVTQSNTVASGATATNANATEQSATQAQSGDCKCGSGTQAVGQEAHSSQAAGALSHASQQDAGNENISVRVQSPGNDGNVSQSNTAASGAAAANANATGQSANQASTGGTGTQATGQAAKNEQAAVAGSSAEQKGAKNTNISVRVQSPGDDGDVEQSNTVASAARAGNVNTTGQDASQAGGAGTQAIGQDAKSDQTAAALSSAEQTGARNEHIAVRVQSPGDGGDVTQTNAVSSAALAGNVNGTAQHATQAGRGDCRCGSGTQAIGQDAKSEQGALAVSGAEQSGARNASTPVRVHSRGDDGDVEQANTVGSAAIAGNVNGLEQSAAQTQSGDCRCESDGVQSVGQKAANHQGALALSLASQDAGDRCGCRSGGNSHAPVRVDSEGDGGAVSQSNTVGSIAAAGSLNGTRQAAGQSQSGGGVQAVGQEAKSEQAAIGLSAALQHGASNAAAPVRVDSRGDDGDVSQSNGVASAAHAGNANLTAQEAAQAQSGSCGCHGHGIQAIGQKAGNEQLAGAGSLALQLGASNASSPVRVHSQGGGGSLEQSNDAVFDAGAQNLNVLGQSAGQAQAGGGTAVQAIGQSASNAQAALAFSAALQLGASNASSPVLVGGRADGGAVSQSNRAASGALAGNANRTGQRAAQRQASSCGCHGIPIQALGQSAGNAQLGIAASLALQCGAGNGTHALASRSAPDPRGWRGC